MKAVGLCHRLIHEEDEGKLVQEMSVDHAAKVYRDVPGIIISAPLKIDMR